MTSLEVAPAAGGVSTSAESTSMAGGTSSSAWKPFNKNWSVGVDQLSYRFTGVRPADGDIYSFDDVSLDMQMLTYKLDLSAFTSIKLVGSYITNYAETYFMGSLYKDRAKGWGDTLLTLSHTHIFNPSTLALIDVGLSTPTGSVNKKNANNTSLNYPYNMQLGSGTWDPTLSALVLKTLWSKHQLGALALAKVRTGRNENGYRLGHEQMYSLWYSYIFSSYLVAMAKWSLKNTEAIQGEDETFGRNMFTEFYHHNRKYWDFTLSLTSSVPLSASTSLQLLVAAPLWQGFDNIDNVEVDMKWYGQVGLRYQMQ